MADMVRHGRQGAYTHPERVARGERHSSRTKPWAIPRGERHPCARVTEEQVRAVRRLHSTLGSISATARALGISRDTAKFILNGRTWRHVQS
jgi:DNA invertase Pin-like site-specific DNA recombinase